MSIDKDGLAPCPFCGAELEAHGTTFAHPRGSDCILVTTGVHANDAERVAAWNRRALLNTGDELVARLRNEAVAFEDAEENADAFRCEENVSHAALLRQAADAIVSLTSRAQAAEASLASARETLQAIAAKTGPAASGTSIRALAGLSDIEKTAIRALKEVQK